MERLAGFAVGVDGGDRLAGVATLAQGGHERELTEQGNAEFVGQFLAAPGAEDLVARSVVSREPASCSR